MLHLNNRNWKDWNYYNDEWKKVSTTDVTKIKGIIKDPN
jgi:hypothetical protein